MSRIVDRGAIVAPDVEVVTATAAGARRQTMAETRARAHQLAHALYDAGIRPGDRFGTFMWNGSRHLEAYHAAAGMGAVLHTLNIRLSPNDIEYIVRHAEDRIILVDADALPLLEALAGRIPSVELVVVAVEEGFENWHTSVAPAVDYEAFIAGKPDRYAWPELDENAPLGLCYTSGTTGNPKGVEYEHRSQYLHTMALCMTDSMGLSATDTVLGIVPMFHAMGWGIPWSALMLGLQTGHAAPLHGSGAAGSVDGGRAGHAFGWRADHLAGHEGGHRGGAREVRSVCPLKAHVRRFGAAAFADSLVSRRAWRRDDPRLGHDRNQPVATLSRQHMKHKHPSLALDEQLANLAKAGQLMPGLELDIFDEDFNRLPHDGETIGEVLVRGPWICSEYYKDPQPERFHDGWLITGDVGKIDSEQYLIIADRSKDLVKSGGEWISSVDLENHIVALAGVAQACVVAQPHPIWGERPVALVILEPHAAVSPPAILEHCATRYAKWQLPDDVIPVDAIPLTSTGKMDKKSVRANLAEEGYRLPDQRAAGDSA